MGKVFERTLKMVNDVMTMFGELNAMAKRYCQDN